jgi:hypothetical protein
MRLSDGRVAALSDETAAGLDEGQPAPAAPTPAAAHRVAPGISTAGALARLTSHSR